MTGDAYLFHRLGGFSGGVSLAEPLLPASSLLLTRNTRSTVACCHCMTAGWGETEVLMDFSPRRPARVLHRHLAERGLLSFLGLLRAVRLHVIKRNQGFSGPQPPTQHRELKRTQ